MSSTANCGPRSLVMRQGSLCIFHMLSLYNSVSRNAMISVVVGIRWIIFENRSMMVSIALCPFDSSKGLIRSMDMSSQGLPGTLCRCSGFALGCRDALFHWQVSQPLTYFFRSVSSVSHQYCLPISLFVLKMPGCPATGALWVSWRTSCRILGSGGM
jgi:hypothetical protein